jgi:hypothetical protein
LHKFDEILDLILKKINITDLIICGNTDYISNGMGQPFKDLMDFNWFSTKTIERADKQEFEKSKVTSFHNTYESIPITEYVIETIIVDGFKKKEEYKNLYNNSRILDQYEIRYDSTYTPRIVLCLDKIKWFNICRIMACVPPKTSKYLLYVIGEESDFEKLIEEAKSKSKKSSAFGSVLDFYFFKKIPDSKSELE